MSNQGFFNTTPFQIPEQFRAFAENGVNQARDGYQKMKAAAESNNQALEAVYASAAKGASGFTAKLVDIAQANVTSSFEVFLTPNGLMFLGVGTLVGAAFATLLFSLTVVSLPLLLDREVDFVTAMLTSLACVRENPVVMLGWGVIISALLFLGMLPGFLGLFLVLPVLGHATWHLYRRALS